MPDDNDLIPISELSPVDLAYLTDQEIGAGSVRRLVLERRRHGAEMVALTQLRSEHEPLLVRQSVNRGGRKMSTTSATPIELGDSQ